MTPSLKLQSTQDPLIQTHRETDTAEVEALTSFP